MEISSELKQLLGSDIIYYRNIGENTKIMDFYTRLHKIREIIINTIVSRSEMSRKLADLLCGDLMYYKPFLSQETKLMDDNARLNKIRTILYKMMNNELTPDDFKRDTKYYIKINSNSEDTAKYTGKYKFLYKDYYDRNTIRCRFINKENIKIEVYYDDNNGSDDIYCTSEFRIIDSTKYINIRQTINIIDITELTRTEYILK